MSQSKAELWQAWIEATLVRDIHAFDCPDPVSFLTTDGDEGLTTTAELDQYRYGKNDGEYLYLIYLADQPVETAADITPVYVGESSAIGSRIYQHYTKITEALPVAEWSDDGSWGSFSTYDHLAAVRAQADGELFVWILDVAALDVGPYGVPTYRQELEATLVGLSFAQPAFRRALTNREFVPNGAVREIGAAGPAWLSAAGASNETDGPHQAPAFDTAGASKPELWSRWCDEYVGRDLADETTADPIPLFATDDHGRVELTDKGRLERSAAIDERIRAEGRTCVDGDGVRDDGGEGLLYLMYQLDETGTGQPEVVPRYLGKAEASGKQRELSANFQEIAHERAGSKSFARWGDGDYWHVGELSMVLFEDDTRKLAWADALFEDGTRRLTDQTYLWTRAWHPEQDVGPYGYPATLAEVEPLLIGTAYAAAPQTLLNKSGVPDDAPVKTREHAFEPVE